MAAHLTGIHSAIKMLNSRIKVLHHYLEAMEKGICITILMQYSFMNVYEGSKLRSCKERKERNVFVQI